MSIVREEEAVGYDGRGACLGGVCFAAHVRRQKFNKVVASRWVGNRVDIWKSSVAIWDFGTLGPGQHGRSDDHLRSCGETHLEARS